MSKKCDTCEQRWEAFYGTLTVSEITVSHETDKTVTVYTDRGSLGASTRKQNKEGEYFSVHKSPQEAWQAVAYMARAKMLAAQSQADYYKEALAKAEANIAQQAATE